MKPRPGGFEFHDVGCKLLETGSCYDQLNLDSCSIAECLMRGLMCTGERYKNRALGSTDTSLAEMALFQGQEQRAAICVHPSLVAHIGKELVKEALTLKKVN